MYIDYPYVYQQSSKELIKNVEKIMRGVGGAFEKIL